MIVVPKKTLGSPWFADPLLPRGHVGAQRAEAPVRSRTSTRSLPLGRNLRPARAEVLHEGRQAARLRRGAQQQVLGLRRLEEAVEPTRAAWPRPRGRPGPRADSTGSRRAAAASGRSALPGRRSGGRKRATSPARRWTASAGACVHRRRRGRRASWARASSLRPASAPSSGSVTKNRKPLLEARRARPRGRP